MQSTFKNWPFAAVMVIIMAIIDLLLAYAAGWELGNQMILSLAIIDLAFIIVIGFTVLVPSSPNSHIFAITSLMTLSIFLLVEVVLGLVVFFVSMDDLTGVLVFQAVILLLVLAVMIWQTYLNMRSAKRDREMVAYRNDVLLEFKRRADAIIAKASGKSYEKTVESAVDSVLSMPMRSKEDTLGMDKEVIAKMDELLSVIGTDDDGAVDYICRQLKDAVLRRNTQFKKDQM